jgi:hypothetical protein
MRMRNIRGRERKIIIRKEERGIGGEEEGNS